MPKHTPSLEAAAGSIAPKPTAKVVPGPGARLRADRPHVSLYLGKAVQKAIKEIALTFDKRPHDILIEGVNLVLAQYGRGSIAKIEGKS